jgi:hypothetical protein
LLAVHPIRDTTRSVDSFFIVKGFNGMASLLFYFYISIIVPKIKINRLGGVSAANIQVQNLRVFLIIKGELLREIYCLSRMLAVGVSAFA